jgi:predicted MPP superfamily phosphohydrolase
VVVQLSDFHCDVGLEERTDAILAEVLEALDEIRPDLIVLTGDYVNRTPMPVARFCRTFVEKLDGKSKLGVFCSLGNHDAYGDESETPPPFRDCMEYITHCLTEAGATVLRNQTVEATSGIWICGLEDAWNPAGWRGHRPVMQELHQKDEACLRLVMSHNPDTARQLCEFRYDLQLSGHTHGGQICLPSGWTDRRYNVPVLGLLRPVFDWAIVRFAFAKLVDMRKKRRYSYVVDHWEWSQGLHWIESEAGFRKQLYVTRGIGTHRNMRLFCPPELSVLKIVFYNDENSQDGQQKKDH